MTSFPFQASCLLILLKKIEGLQHNKYSAKSKSFQVKAYNDYCFALEICTSQMQSTITYIISNYLIIVNYALNLKSPLCQDHRIPEIDKFHV